MAARIDNGRVQLLTRTGLDWTIKYPGPIAALAKLVVEITYLTWTADNLLRHTVYVGLREDKPADQVRREAERA
jgi:ATP-dependent DNA ligase